MTMSKGQNSLYSEPATAHLPITVIPTVFANERPKGIFVGTGGNVVLTMSSDDITVAVTVSTVYKNIPSGTILPVKAMSIDAGTTAQDMIALF